MKGKYLQKLEAIKLRKEKGFSIQEIATHLLVAKSSVSNWVRDYPLTEQQRECLNKKVNHNRFGNTYARDSFLKVRLRYQEEGREMVKTLDSNFIAGCMLFWAEGSKKRNTICFVNSDLNMMRFFINFLRKYFVINEEKIALYINCYSRNELTIEEIKNKWLEVMSLKDSNIRKIYIDRDKRSGSNKSIGKLPYGVGTFYINRTDIIQKIYGAIQEQAQFKELKWLMAR
jgi:transposase-like protein